jgi:hypothetical protein
MTTTPALADDVLEANRQGRLTDSQRKGWTGVERSWRSDFGFAAVFCAVLGVGLLSGFLSARGDSTRVIGGVGFVIAAGVFAYLALFRGRPLAQDLRAGRVEVVEGAIGRDRLAGTGSTPSRHWLEVGGQRYECGVAEYETAEQPGIARVYYLPRSRRVVNFERLPDRPLPPGALDDRAALDAAVRGARSHDAATRDEARATMAAIQHATFGPAAAQTDGAADGRPLAESIAGSWRSPLGEVVFAADGGARAQLANGVSLTGRWSAGPDGTLHLEGMGGQLVTDARVTGDTLSLTIDSTSVVFHRAGG